jgi:3-methylcrotonyl-CoA carboxylase beta subunit
MELLQSSLDTASLEFAANREHLQSLDDNPRQCVAAARDMVRRRKQGKMSVWERIAALVDPDTPFAPLAANEMYDGEAPGVGIVTGIGRVRQRECLILGKDATVNDGTYFLMPKEARFGMFRM